MPELAFKESEKWEHEADRRRREAGYGSSDEDPVAAAGGGAKKGAKKGGGAKKVQSSSASVHTPAPGRPNGAVSNMRATRSVLRPANLVGSRGLPSAAKHRRQQRPRMRLTLTSPTVTMRVGMRRRMRRRERKGVQLSDGGRLSRRRRN